MHVHVTLSVFTDCVYLHTATLTCKFVFKFRKALSLLSLLNTVDCSSLLITP